MNYTEALEYIHSICWTFTKPGLERISELCERLGNPQKKLKFIHVAGTNGKGSTSTALACILKEAGYKTGLFTSPYVVEFGERIQVGGKYIPKEDIAEICELIKEKIEREKAERYEQIKKERGWT